MTKKLDLSKSVYELIQEYPELVEILKNLGFTEIVKPAMRSSVGRMMTIPKGAKMKGISMMEIVTTLMQNGFELTGTMPIQMGSMLPEEKESDKDNTTEQLKKYLKRLGNGEDLEAVRADFAEHFSEVEAAEIMKAEQDLMKEGTPLEEVQKLCDVHSALFHGATREERIYNAELAVAESLKKEVEHSQLTENTHKESIGHPLYTMHCENDGIASEINRLKQELETNNNIQLSNLRQLSVHYAKKGDLLYPVLKVRYEITGPSEVMWTVDDEIRDELAALDRMETRDEDWAERFKAVLKRAEEMIYKEENILFPICAEHFSNEEWYGIYEDAKDYAVIFDAQFTWEEAEQYNADRKEKAEAELSNGEIVLAGGHLRVDQLEAMLNTLPLEISFVDDRNINRYFNEGPKVFKRPQMAIDREVFSCHPPKIEPMVRMILEDFRNQKRDRVPVWMEKNGKPFLVTYMAVRNRKGDYLGTIEIVQDMSDVKEHFLPSETM